MIKIFDNTYVIESKNSSYVFRVTKTGHLEHLYYGKRIIVNSAKDADALEINCAIAPGNTILYNNESGISFENRLSEMSQKGKGDIGESFIELEYEDGMTTSDFTFSGLAMIGNKPEYSALPTAYVNEDDNVSSLKLLLTDKEYGLIMESYYTVYYDTDVITRQNILINKSDKKVKIKRLMSMQLDFDRSDYVFTTFNGAWAREMNRNDFIVTSGKHINSSNAGTSSNRANPFVMLSENNATEDSGKCYGMNLIYSGNHYECAEVNNSDHLRFVSGINPENFGYILEPSQSFEAPEAVFTFSADGFNGMSNNMHRFVRENIVRGKYKKKDRPILLNSWEASYFAINEHKLLNLAKKAKEVGIELFVMDDGWFLNRDDDTKALGDWDVDKSKLPNGLKGLAKKINDLGLEFGIWVEPEMVNENSNLYKKHPEWVIMHNEHPHSTGRNQMILNLGNEVVQNFIIDKMSEVFSSANISYVKWDMNRIFSDYYSHDYESDKMCELSHRYILGLYRVMKELTERFPDILFEGCASGGNRFDLGILCYFPQIWASDNTDAICRTTIQTGYSYGYPRSVMSAHVSGVPNHQTLRVTPLDTRFNVASIGILGYECNLCDLSKAELDEIRDQIAFYKEKRHLLQWGSFYRGRSFKNNNVSSENITEWTIVSEDKNEAIAIMVQSMVTPNKPLRKIYIKGLDAQKKYSLTNRQLKYSIKAFGDLINTVTKVHVKKDSAVHNIIDKFYKLDSEKENIEGYGITFMESGVNLKQGFAGTGFGDNVATFQDYGSRLYIINSINE